MHTLINILLVLHIIGGFVALITGFIASITAKGKTRHRQSGRLYFWGMTVVFVTAIVIGIARERWFLFMVGFFSYYLVVRGYRILYLKKLGAGQSARWIDWGVAGIAMTFGLALLVWSFLGAPKGIAPVALVFGVISMGFAARDIQLFVIGPKLKNHWVFGHITSMGAGYIATWTAFVVTNVHFLPPAVVWLAPTAVGTVCILLAERKYKAQGMRPARVVAESGGQA